MFTLLLTLANPALALEPGDWANTRWQLSVEAVLPIEVDLQARDNYEFILKAYQMRTVVGCNDGLQQVAKNLVLTCTFEDVAIQTIPHGETPSEREVENTQKVIEDVVDRMKGQDLEVSFNKSGKVTRVDVLMPEGRNTRDRRSRERIRQMATDLATGFTFKEPKSWTGTWQEINSPLAKAPTVPPAGSSSTIDHSGAEADGKVIVQSQGAGLAAAYNVAWELEGAGKVSGKVVSSGSSLSGGGGSNAPTVSGERITMGTQAGGATASEATPEIRRYNVSIRSVAVIDDGLLAERVWSVAGAGTASSVGAFQGVNLWYNGHIRRLPEGETPDLGPTRLVTPPGVQVGDLPPWKPMGE